MGKYFLLLAATYIIPVLFTNLPAKNLSNIILPVSGEAAVSKEIVYSQGSKAPAVEKAKEQKNYSLFTDKIFLHI